ncbi:hypothetical protein LQZ18_15595 [Lachnospiraceae bacterium ZAX-1]
MNNEEKILSILEKLTTDVAQLTTNVAQLTTDVAEIKDTLKVHSTRLDHLSDSFDVLTNLMLDQAKALQNLNKRVEQLEKAS